MTPGSRFAAITLVLLTAGAAVAAPAPGARRPVPPTPGTAAPPAARPVTPTAPLTAAERTLVNPNTVFVFPFDKAPQPNAPLTLGETIAGDLRRGMDASGKYSAAAYYRNSPLVARAMGSGITQE